jgi:hypothetical protein
VTQENYLRKNVSLKYRNNHYFIETNHAASGNHYLSESGRFLIFERRGIKTDLFAIERYVEEVLEEVLKERMKFMNGIQTPLSKNAREVLN